MLPASARLRLSRDFARVTRYGRRAGSRTLVVHAVGGGCDRPRVGFVVGRAVGGSVVRNRVTRRLRQACRDRLELFVGGDVVVRALPAAAAADSDRLLTDLESCLRRAGATR